MNKKVVILSFLSLMFCSTSFAISKGALDVCQSMWSDQQVSCLQEFRYDQHDARAVSICDGMFGDSDKVLCLRATANKSYSYGALEICEDMFSSDLIQCLGVTANKTYTPYELETCEDSFSSDKLNCLRNLGGQDLGRALEDAIADGVTDFIDGLFN